MIVADASVVVTALLRDGLSRQRLAGEDIHVPHLVDTEVSDALRKLVLRQAIEAQDAGRALSVWGGIGVRRYAAVGLLSRMWQLRHNVSAYDATYVALAESLGCTLISADARLAGATGINCPVEVVPRQ